MSNVKSKEKAAAYTREWRAKNPERHRAAVRASRLKRAEYYREYHRAYRARVKSEVFGHYGGTPPCCSCCGEDEPEFLAIDHIDGNGAAERRQIGHKGGNWFYAWLRRRGFPAGYRVLCHNCNNARGHFGYCPHEKKMRSLLGRLA